jgi:hypothetical protein
MDPRAKVGSAAGWFLAIAGFTVVNWALGAADAGMRFPVGVVTPELLALFFPSAKLAVGGVAAVLCGGFFYLTSLGTKRLMTWVMCVGAFWYALDTLLYLPDVDWMGLALHGWALYSIIVGIVACFKFKRNPQAYIHTEEAQAPEAGPTAQ